MHSEALIDEWLSICTVFDGVSLDMIAAQDGSLTISRITQLDGHASGVTAQAIGTLCSLADHHNVPLYAPTDPLAESEEERVRLKTWLMHYGFTPSSYPQNNTLIRVPESLAVPLFTEMLG